MRIPAKLVVSAVAVGIAALLTPPVLMLMAITGGNIDVSGNCSGTNVVLAAGTMTDQFDAAQRGNIAQIITVGKQMRVPDQAILIALTVARQESGFRNYANDGRGTDLTPAQRGIAASLRLPHDAVGSDHGSVGVFQQQWPSWGSLPELMTPAVAAEKFYARLLRVPGWPQMSITQAAQAVQHSAHPNAYADDVPAAYELLTGQHAPDGEQAASALSLAGGDCSAVDPGLVGYPLPPGTSRDERNFGDTGASWATVHTGTDLAAPCGTPVLAATNGTVVVRTDQPWAGDWLVEVSTGAGRLTTWYGHMRSLTVVDGQEVAAGQQLGEVGDLGNATGCHLHFEVHPTGGGYGQDDVDPSAWLAENSGQELSTEPAGHVDKPTPVTLLTANIERTLPATTARNRIHDLLAQGADVAILQEVRKRDVTSIAGSAQGRWGVWQARPGTFAGEIAVVWDATKYAPIRQGVLPGYQGAVGYDRWIPWVLLRSSTGTTLPVVGIHMPTGAYKSQLWRSYYRRMTGQLQSLLVELGSAGYPPIAGGDWNASLNSGRRSWGPVQALERVGLTTNWMTSQACASSTRIHGGRIDGFAYSPGAYQLLEQGCLPSGASDHRPVWATFLPMSKGAS